MMGGKVIANQSFPAGTEVDVGEYCAGSVNNERVDNVLAGN